MRRLCCFEYPWDGNIDFQFLVNINLPQLKHNLPTDVLKISDLDSAHDWKPWHTHTCFYKTCVKKTQMTYKCSWNMVVMGSLLIYAPHLVAKRLSISMYKPQNPPLSADPWHLQDDFPATVRQISHWLVVNLHGKLENSHHYRYFHVFPYWHVRLVHL